MKDKLINAISGDGFVRVIAADTKNIVTKAQGYHDTTPTTTALLGRLLTAASLMGSDLKDKDFSVTLRVDGDGPSRGAVAVSDGLGNCRGYVRNPDVDLPRREGRKLDVGGAVGKGSLTVIKDMHLKEPYIGKVELVSGEIAEDIAAYMQESEQTPGACSLGVLIARDYSVAAAGGFILALMPGADESVISRVERDLADIPTVTSMLESGMSVEQMAERVLQSDFGGIIRTLEIDYICGCSTQRTKEMLLSLGRAELESLKDRSEEIEALCHFCAKKYVFMASDLLLEVKD